MLVLSRKTKQSIMIGDDVEITVLSIDAGKVRLGIQAPAEVTVHRTEIYLEIQEGGSRREARARDAEREERASRGDPPSG